MDLQLTEQSVVVFDLDDTLYAERDYVRSGFDAVGRAVRAAFGLDVADELYAAFRAGSADPLADMITAHHLPPALKPALLQVYRVHFPTLCLPFASAGLLERLKALSVPLALITDGRSLTQRLKLAGLGIREDFACLCISEEVGAEKPDPTAYRQVMAHWPEHRHFVYIADNPRKDFIAPNALGWLTIGVRHALSGIHAQVQPEDMAARPAFWVDSLSELVPTKEAT